MIFESNRMTLKEESQNINIIIRYLPKEILTMKMMKMMKISSKRDTDDEEDTF